MLWNGYYVVLIIFFFLLHDQTFMGHFGQNSMCTVARLVNRTRALQGRALYTCPSLNKIFYTCLSPEKGHNFCKIVESNFRICMHM